MYCQILHIIFSYVVQYVAHIIYVYRTLGEKLAWIFASFTPVVLGNAGKKPKITGRQIRLHNSNVFCHQFLLCVYVSPANMNYDRTNIHMLKILAIVTYMLATYLDMDFGIDSATK